jgi:hypothetical protein
MIPVYYAVQTCTTKSNQGKKRFCSDSKSEVTKKCVTSLFQSIQHSISQNEAIHYVTIFDDSSDKETIDYLHKLCDRYSSDNIKPEFKSTKKPGLMNSVRECYSHLVNNGSNIGYQVQDDYLFEEQSVFEMIDIFYQIFNDTETLPFVSGYHPPHWYYDEDPKDRYKVEPICMIHGANRYWRQAYNTSCSFLTSIDNYIKNWDLLEVFLNSDPLDEKLEPKSLNKMFTTRGELMVVPVNSITFHMQYDAEKDPFKDWKPLWNSINID